MSGPLSERPADAFVSQAENAIISRGGHTPTGTCLATCVREANRDVVTADAMRGGLVTLAGARCESCSIQNADPPVAKPNHATVLQRGCRDGHHRARPVRAPGD